MNATTGLPVLVGVDGSPSALRAVEVAAREAVLRGRPLRVLNVFGLPALGVPMAATEDASILDGLRADADFILAEGIRVAREHQPGLEVSGEVITGLPSLVLRDASAHAELIVLGDSGMGGLAGALVGSIAGQVATHALCPALVVRGEARTGGPVVVGVDGSEHSAAAVEFAVREAALRGAELIAIHAWRWPGSAGPGDMRPLVYDEPSVIDEEGRVLGEALAGVATSQPDLKITQQVVHDSPAAALIDAGAQAQLLVAGTRGGGGFLGLLLGSTSHALLHHAPCPLVLVRAAK